MSTMLGQLYQLLPMRFQLLSFRTYELVPFPLSSQLLQ
jgi:hypothetical protein